MKNKKLCIVLALQIIVLGILTIGLFGKRESIEMSASFFDGVGEYKEDAWHIDESYGEQEFFLTSRELSLPAGVYKVQLLYETDTNALNRCSISDPFAVHEGVLSNGEALYAGLNSTDYDVWVMDGNGSLMLTVSYGGQGEITVLGARMYDTGALQRMILFAVFVLFLAIDGLYGYCYVQKKRNTFAGKKGILLALGLIIIYSSYPLMTNYVLSGGDLGFHLLRIEGVKDGLLAGQFPVRIAPEWQQGYGYASSIFYGDTLLYIPALLRIIGFPMQTSYKFFLFLLNVGTCLISYYAFVQVFKNKYIGVLSCMLYTMSIYRFFKVYYSAGLGEAIALMFLPLILVGLYKIFTEDIKAKKYYWNWVLPTIGFCGTIQSHILTTYIAAMFVILLCVIMWKKVLRRETFLVLSATVIFTSVACAWFLVPFFDYMSEGTFVINNVSGREIQFRGLQVAQLLKVYFPVGSNPYYYEHGMVDAEPIGIGGALLVGMSLFLVLCWTGTIKNINKQFVKTGTIATIMAVLAMAMSTQYFPWDRIQRLSGITATLVSSIQFPSRFLCIATIALVLVTGIAGLCIWNTNNAVWKMGFVMTIMMFFLAGSIFVLNDMGHSKSFFRLYNVGGMGTGYISGAEYLPVGTDASLLWYRDALAGENVTISDYEKEYLSARLSCTNDSESESFVELPILYYDGYQAEGSTGESLEVCAGENNVVRVIVPGGFAGEISVGFVSPWYWRVAEILSVVFTFGLLGVWCLNRRKEKLQCAKSQL